MSQTSPIDLVRRRFMEAHGANVQAGYGAFLQVSHQNAAHAALGYRRACEETLFLERYLDCPVEHCLSLALQRTVERTSVIEIGNLAADDAFAMVALWGMAANDLGANCEIAVATLTAPLRRMFERLGVTLHVLAKADPKRAGDPRAWGSYYASDPMVCAGFIALGQTAISAFLARRRKVAA
ncbi:thermostable hemolysin [Novosphingobium pentaromativorans]|nr:thermostable hemolysin [Novosphingobium pentaromativorans]AIT82041.1 hypothetical protein JI59_21065 [Novosphingobium pentaromativorans US6-1]